MIQTYYETLTVIFSVRLGVVLYFACVNVSVQVVAFFGAINLPAPILHRPVFFQLGKPFPTVLIRRSNNVLEPFFTVLTDDNDAVPPAALALIFVEVSVVVGAMVVGAMVAGVVVTLPPTFAPASNCAYTWLALWETVPDTAVTFTTGDE